ncbi:MAG TPA: exodeoxyribonuclease VII large subunit, partial [Aggregatilineaceae bacterium]|nr:exodeoxyribonuclease VII large subunit [Aggregatilineaceae bacterium]
RGQYQLVCDVLQPAGLGMLNLQFERLKAQLEQEGLFDSTRKRPIPFFPRRIGIVTSATTAAFQDMQNVIRRRCPAVHLILSPTPVQGKDAPPQIIEALRRLNAQDDIDVIILARGGGSLEDLWCFNDEALVRAVAASKTPVVTGVGHEIDFTLVDFAADYRAPTPSAAAELVTPDSTALRTSIRSLTHKLESEMLAALDSRTAEVETAARLLTRFSPQVRINNARQRIDDWTTRMDTGMQHRLGRRRDRLAAATRALEAASPTALLRRGYAMITRGDGTRVTSARQTAEGTLIHITLQDGKLTASVRERKIVVG